MRSSMKISAAGQRVIVAFAVIVMGVSFWAMKFSRHPTVWLILLTASIPLFAAVAGSFFVESGRSGE
jgi:hypothetical protein